MAVRCHIDGSGSTSIFVHAFSPLEVLHVSVLLAAAHLMRKQQLLQWSASTT
jgi:hypothetical protein